MQKRTLPSSLTALARLPWIRTLHGAFPRAMVFLVGGAVRDALLKRPTKDYDFVVRGIAGATLERFLKRRGRVDLVGKTFGVYKFTPTEKLPKGMASPLDVALPRTEHAFMTGGYRDFRFKPNPSLAIEKDLERRDFTINAMAVDLRKGTLVDPTGGLGDLGAKRIRAVGVPTKRFTEDYSRLLRALRFACQLDCEIEKKTWNALRKLAPRLSSPKLPREVVAKELSTMFLAAPPKALDLLDVSGALRVLLPELLPMKRCPQSPQYHSEGSVWNHTRLALEAIGSPAWRRTFGTEQPEAELVFAVLFHDLGKPKTLRKTRDHRTWKYRFYGHDRLGASMAEAICRRLKLSAYEGRIDCARLAWLIRWHLLGLETIIRSMRDATIEKYFLTPTDPKRTLLKLIFCDYRGSKPADGIKHVRGFSVLRRRVARIAKRGYRQNHAAPLATGHDVMRLLKIPSGKRVGILLEKLRDAQLSGKVRTKEEAERFILRKNA